MAPIILHGLQRLYHNVDRWRALVLHPFPHLVELVLVRYSNAGLRLFCTTPAGYINVVCWLVW